MMMPLLRGGGLPQAGTTGSTTSTEAGLGAASEPPHIGGFGDGAKPWSPTYHANVAATSRREQTTMTAMMLVKGNHGRWVRAVALGAALAATLCTAQAAVQAVTPPDVKFSATDLPNPGAADLWQIDFKVTGPLPAADSLHILFSASSYANVAVANGFDLAFLANPVFAVVFPPVDLVAGYVTVSSFDGLASSPPVVVSVTFDWKGVGKPGAQSVEFFEGSNAQPTLSFSSTPAAAVPELAGAWMMMAGLAGLGAFGACRRAQPSRRDRA